MAHEKRQRQRHTKQLHMRSRERDKYHYKEMRMAEKGKEYPRRRIKTTQTRERSYQRYR